MRIPLSPNLIIFRTEPLLAQPLVCWRGNIVAEAEFWNRERDPLQRRCRFGSGSGHAGLPLRLYEGQPKCKWEPPTTQTDSASLEAPNCSVPGLQAVGSLLYADECNSGTCWLNLSRERRNGRRIYAIPP
jgi:hypothetical protein